MAAKERQINERSLENLKLGAQARYQGKVRHNVSLLPETMEWLKKGGNASQRIDELVKAAKNSDSKSDYTQNRKVEDRQDSSIVYNQINQLKTELEQLRQERDRLAGELAACQVNQQPQPQQVDLEAIRDRVLAELKLGKQAPGYKGAVKALNRLIALIR